MSEGDRAAGTAYVGLGANLGDPVRQIETALRELAGWGPLRVSSLYRTEPLGDPTQPWYVNAVAELRGIAEPVSLLARLQALEERAGRRRSGRRWESRRLDLDLLLVGDLVLDRPGLRLPHPELHRRRFVLEPLVELAPAVRDPRSGRSAGELLEALDDPLRVQKLERPSVLGPRSGAAAHAAPAPALEVPQR